MDLNAHALDWKSVQGRTATGSFRQLRRTGSLCKHSIHGMSGLRLTYVKGLNPSVDLVGKDAYPFCAKTSLSCPGNVLSVACATVW